MKVYEFKKNLREIVRIESQVYKGVEIVNIRVYFNAGGRKEAAKWIPTKKGLALRKELISELKKGLDEADNAQCEEGNQQELY